MPSECFQELEVLKRYLLESEKFNKTLLDTADYLYFKSKNAKPELLGIFLCQSAAAYFLCKSGVISSWKKNYNKKIGDYRTLPCTEAAFGDYDIYLFYEGLNDKYSLLSKKHIGVGNFKEKKVDIMKKIIPKHIISKNKDQGVPTKIIEIIRNYVYKGKLRSIDNLKQRPIIMLHPEIKIIWKGVINERASIP